MQDKTVPRSKLAELLAVFRRYYDGNQRSRMESLGLLGKMQDITEAMFPGEPHMIVRFGELMSGCHLLNEDMTVDDMELVLDVLGWKVVDE